MTLNNGGGALVGVTLPSGSEPRGTAVMSGVYFEDNVATGNGGGLAVSNTLTLNSATFIGNISNSNGGGVAVGRDTVIDNSHFESNFSLFNGGGLLVADTVIMSNSTVISNTTTQSGGGLAASDTTVFNSRFEGNQATINGGGLAVRKLNLHATDFINNITEWNGGGAFALSTTTIIGGRFERNRCTEIAVFDCTGGGLVTWDTLYLTGTKFIENEAVLGGGLDHDGNEAWLTNALFVGNTANTGAGLRVKNGNVRVVHSTIVDQEQNPSQAVFIQAGGVGITNTILANHAIGIQQGGGVVFEDYNLYFNTSATTAGTVASGGHSLTGDPKFVDTANNDYHLGVDSAAIDQGVDAGVMFDLDGNPRPLRQGFDIGVYEAPADIYLPLVLKNAHPAPDLIIENLLVSQEAITVVIKNVGTAPVVDAFWVDIYIQPDNIPTGVNQPWPMLGSQGMVWGVTSLPIAVGDSLILTMDDPYYQADLSNFVTPFTIGSSVYGQVDSANAETTYGGVLESHEIQNSVYNNIVSGVSGLADRNAITTPIDHKQGITSDNDLPTRP